jgi:hypothetical protein
MPPARSRRDILPGAIILGVMLVAVAGGLIWFGSRGGDEPEYPEAWDGRARRLVEFLEEERGLEFQHPVAIEFLPSEEFAEAVEISAENFTTDELEEIVRDAAYYRSLGLLEGDIDLLEEYNRASGEVILAYYDPEEERIFVNASRVEGLELTPYQQATLVHELTHVLQDQHFDLERLGSFGLDEIDVTFRAMAEGDAVRMQSRWIQQLDVDEFDEYLEEEEKEFGDIEDLEPTEGAEVLGAYGGVPYGFGSAFVQMIELAKGEGAVDDLLRSPPFSEEQLVHPWTYLATDRPDTLPNPPLDPGDELFEEGGFGAVTWFLMLAERIDPATALAAVDGWGGDSHAVFDRNGRVCVRARFVGDTAGDTERMSDALEQWADSMPDEADIDILHVEDFLQLTTCDPGVDAELDVTGRSVDALAAPINRTALAIGLFYEQKELAVQTVFITDEQIECLVDEFVERLTFDQLADPESVPDDQMQTYMTESADICIMY